MNKLNKYIIEEVENIKNLSLLYVQVGNDIVTNKPHFTEILSVISDFLAKAKGAMEKAGAKLFKGEKVWVYVLSFPDEQKRKKFAEELSKIHPELEIKMPETMK